MKLLKLVLLTVLSMTVSVSFATAGTAAAPSTCSFSDLTGVTVTKCAGFASGNLINNSPASVGIVVSILKNTFGVDSAHGAWIDKLEGLNGNKTIDFTTPLSGRTIVALHFGGGNGGPGNGTAFYEFNAGTRLDTFMTKFKASSNAAVYLTSAVPEPETYAMLLAGLGLVGGIARRRKKSNLLA